MREHLLLNGQDIKEIREKIEKYEWAKNLYERVKNDTTFEQMSKDEVIDGSSATDYIWEEGRFMRDRSLIYALTGDDRDIPRMVEILEERFFTNWEFRNLEEFKHFAIPFDFDHMVDYWMLWLYLANHVHAFMLLKNHGLFDQKCLERYEKVFNRILEAKKKNYGEYLELYNCQFWDLTCLGVMGVLLEDDEAVDIAINGHYGFKQMLNKFYDGLFWPEATNTQAFTGRENKLCAECSELLMDFWKVKMLSIMAQKQHQVIFLAVFFQIAFDAFKNHTIYFIRWRNGT